MAAHSLDSRPTGAGESVLLVAVVAEAEADRAALSAAFAGHPEHRVCCSASLAGARDTLEGRAVDAIIGFVVDPHGWRQFRSLAARFAQTPSVLLVSEPDLLDAQADGRVLRAVVDLSREELAQRGALVTSEILADQRTQRTQRTRKEDALAIDRQHLAALSDREREVLTLTAGGLALKEIALQIDRTYSTVASHRTRIMKKLGLHDKVALTRFAIRMGLIDA